MSVLDSADRLIVESVTAKAVAAGAEATARAIRIHRDHLADDYKRADRLTRELAAVHRAIAMREEAVSLLAAPTEALT